MSGDKVSYIRIRALWACMIASGRRCNCDKVAHKLR
eukprot:CAMPEP_0206428526 /NCGR_PEP_ID=MMETSP0324_2-20121206/5722_1 /ASSEMBLY_ACC=CAM_ASM_000836 /TAXON_ID=2866 /ORGANISM="Crypthecodinium cohnii, Strain Seligo" /LENGTH=35 /DNA_ID= /DNA_START= /DNA_END= /DNA_ORIENTATION=